MYPFRLRSHRQPEKLLYDHLKETGNLCQMMVDCSPLSGDNVLSEVATLIGWSHDFGKATTYFQKMLCTQEKSEKTRHSLLSSLFTYYSVKKFLEGKQIQQSVLPLISWIVVLRHHDDLLNLRGTDGMVQILKRSENRGLLEDQIKALRPNIGELKEIYSGFKFIDIDEFTNNLDEIVRRIDSDAHDLPPSLENYFKTIFLYSVLLDADKISASGLGRLPERVLEIDYGLVDRYRLSLPKSRRIDALREEAYNDTIKCITEINLDSKRILTIELPTGYGKTLIGLSVALRLRDRIAKKYGFTPRIIYSLPFLSIIDQNSDVIGRVLTQVFQELTSNLMLTHHHLIDVQYKTVDEELKDIFKALLLIEGWNSEIIITTFVQLFHSLITNKNKSSRKFHNIAGSIIILDEVQNVPYKYWDLIRKSLRLLTEQYGCWVILMTATLPLIFQSCEAYSLVPNKDRYYGLLNRVKYKFDISDKGLTEFIDSLVKGPLTGNKDIMVILNTIQSSKETYNAIKDYLNEKCGEPVLKEDGTRVYYGRERSIALCYLSGNVIPKHRLSRIRTLKELKDYTKVIISTQVVEAGIDMSVDEIYRDFAPLDSIVQAAGRCNRNAEKEFGYVNVLCLVKKDGKRYSELVYDEVLLDATRELLDEIDTIDEKNFNLSIVTKYYDFIKKRGGNVRIADEMKRLNFSSIDQFKLIEEEPLKADVFVEIDEEAEQVFKEYKDMVKEIDWRKKREKYLRIRKDLMNHVVSVNCRKPVHELLYISKGELETAYDLETGLIGDENYLL
ncbi:MAG: CRISPR-associated helicase Cas3' [Nitrososphaerota archaeon]